MHPQIIIWQKEQTHNLQSKPDNFYIRDKEGKKPDVMGPNICYYEAGI